MSALGKTWRLVADNRSGVALAAGGIVAKYRRWKFDSSGIYTPEASEQSITLAASLANASTAASSSITNDASGEFYLGADFRLEYAGLASASTGSVSVFLQTSTDGGTTWPDITTLLVQGRGVNTMSWAAASAAQKGWAQVR